MYTLNHPVMLFVLCGFCSVSGFAQNPNNNSLLPNNRPFSGISTSASYASPTTVNPNTQRSFYCAKTYNTVFLNESLNQVKEKCGAPVSETTQKVQSTKNLTEVLQYIYDYIPTQKYASPRPNALVVSFVQDKVISIEINGQTTEETNICNSSQSFKKGDQRTWVYQLCRQPTIIQVIKKPADTTPTEETVLTYTIDEYHSSVKLHFQEGQLVQIES